MATEIRQNCFFDADCLADEICIENNCVDKKTWFLEQVGYYYDQAKIEGGWQTILKEVVKLLKRIF